MLRRLTIAQGSRRLQVPEMNFEVVADGLESGAGALVTVAAAVHEALFHVLFSVLETSVPTLWSVFKNVFSSGISFMQVVVDAGLLTWISKILQLVIAIVVYLVVPFYMSGFYAIVCMFNLIYGADTWEEQMRCVEKRCFSEQGGQFLGMPGSFWDMFSSLKGIEQGFQAVGATLVNRNTGYTTVPSGGDTLGDFADEAGASIDTSEQRATSLALEQCKQCFSCKVPEIRFISFLAMALSSCFDSSSFVEFQGRVGDQCQRDGPGYIEMCGNSSTEFDLTSDFCLGLDDGQCIYEWSELHPQCMSYSAGFWKSGLFSLRL